MSSDHMGQNEYSETVDIYCLRVPWILTWEESAHVVHRSRPFDGSISLAKVCAGATPGSVRLPHFPRHTSESAFRQQFYAPASDQFSPFAPLGVITINATIAFLPPPAITCNNFTLTTFFSNSMAGATPTSAVAIIPQINYFSFGGLEVNEAGSL